MGPRLALLPLSMALAAGASGCFLEASAATSVGEDDADLRKTQIAFEVQGETTRARIGRGADRRCGPVFEGSEGRRWSCREGDALLEVIVRTANDALAIDWPTGRGGEGPHTTYGCRVVGGDTTAPQALSCRPLTSITMRGGAAFAPTAPGFRLANTHWVDAEGMWIRGSTPRTDADFDELRAAGVKRLLVLDGDAWSDGARLGLGYAQIESVDIARVRSFGEACRGTVRALRELDGARRRGERTFFHGGDATGYLAGLALAISTQGDPARAFQLEACEKGFGAGDPEAPAAALAALDRGLVPVVRKMTWLVASGALGPELDDHVCGADPEDEMPQDGAFAASSFTCGTSTRYRP